ncbi:ABC transporter permease [Halobaculum litoreum]|uniref:ABC-2 type transport system permease protein n=1 Tax=Halobaculum litoreum TaxID=3031998 RepID=A0ABD5XVL8_9EURY|nr:ABC transporter permease [Halobaculum sp. DT92]
MDADGAARTHGGPSAAAATWAVFRFEAERRLRASVLLAVGLSAFGLLFVWIVPDIVAGGNIEEVLASLPPAIVALLGFDTAASVEGLLAGEFYTFGWVVGLAGYVGYSGATAVSAPLGDDRLETLLAAPVARGSVLAGTFLALLVPVAVVNAVVPVVLYAGSRALGAPLSAGGLAAVHALSVPFLLTWGAVGVLSGVVVRRGRTAGRVVLALVFGAWLVESVTSISTYAWVGAVSPSRQFDAAAVLVDGRLDVAGAATLAVVTVAVLLAAQAVFARRDL